MNFFKECRYGKVVISSDLLCDATTQIVKLFHEIEFIPLKVEQHYSGDVLIYTGWSPSFMIIPESCDAPIYIVAINKDKPVDSSKYGGEFTINVEVGEPE